MKKLGLMYPLWLKVKLCNKMMAILKEDNMRMEIGIKMQVLPESCCLHHCGVSEREGHRPGLRKFLSLLDK